MGTRYVLMFNDEKFLASINLAKWNIYSIALQDLTLFTLSYLKVFYNSHETTKAKEIYEDYIATLSKQDIKDIEAFLKKARKPDTKKRDKESVPLNQDVDQYFKNEVLPHAPDAWIDYDKTRIGYEFNFTKYFYQYKPLRAASEVKTEIVDLEKSIKDLLKDLIS